MKKANAVSQTAFFKELEKERHRVNMARKRFAEHIGLSASVYYSWERGRKQRDEKVIEIAQNLKWPEEKIVSFLDEPKTDIEKLARRAMFLGMKKRHVLFMLDIVQHQYYYYVNECYESPQWLKDKLAHYLKAPDAELLAFRYIEDDEPKGLRGVIDYDLIKALESKYGQLSAVPESDSKLKELREKL